MADPIAVSGTIVFSVRRPPNPTGPTIRNLGVYAISPDALLNIQFKGVVSLPPGRWDVGIVQNLWNDRVSIVYSEGGEFYFSFDNYPNLLDNLVDGSDIWLDTLGSGVQRFDVSESRSQNVRVSLEAGDVPTSPPIPGRRKRCGNKIDEQLEYAERTLLLFAAVVCRANGKGGRLFPILATGDVYGFYWKLEPAAGAPDFKFQSILFRSSERPPFKGPIRHGLATSGKIANTVGKQLVQDAERGYLSNCIRSKPRYSGEEDYWLG